MKMDPPDFDSDRDFEWFDSVDSTNRLAREYAAKADFSRAKAFGAAEQSAGVGRQGRGWISIKGNLHLSLAIPGFEVSAEIREVLPLAVGVAVSKWIEKNFEIAPVLKWPNDIVISGYKVGGILCEATSLGPNLKAVCVGVGINLTRAPVLNAEESYFSGSLDNFSNRSANSKECSLDLAQVILQVLRSSNRSNIMDDYRRLATREDQIWVDSSKEIYRQLPFSDDGILRLKDLNGNVVSTSTAENNYKWLGLTKYPLVVADIGNSRTKFALVTRSQDQFTVKSTFGIDNLEYTDDGLEKWLTSCVELGALPFLRYISVNSDAESILLSKARRFGWLYAPLTKNPCRFLKSNYQMERLGIDRFANIEGALSTFSQSSKKFPMMIISLGTATTIDFISSDQKHLGGFIGPGLKTGLTGLLQAAPALPRVSPDLSCAINSFPIESNSAISQSMIRMQLGWIQLELNNFAENQNVNSNEVSVILTGGYSSPLYDAIQSTIEQQSFSHEPHLIFRGATIMGLTRG